jgi:pyridoxamine 5'-phosphate oxidase
VSCEPATESPLETLASWLEEARHANVRDPEAMALATVGNDGSPSVRIVLCRGIDAEGVVFYTNYASRKGKELAANPRAAIVFHWAALGRQVRLEGLAARVSAAESDAYFHSRPRGSQLAACVSPQSQPIDDLAHLEESKSRLEVALGDREVARPAVWGGYRLRAQAVELWIAGRDRLHRRVRYDRDLESGAWARGQLLAP